MRACVRRGECSYVYEYLRLYCISKKKTIISRNDTFKKMKECKIFFPRMGVGLWRDNEGTIEGKKYIRWVQAT
jgi:hypothetical protein